MKERRQDNRLKYTPSLSPKEYKGNQTQVEAIQPIMPVWHQHHTNLSTQDQNKKMQIFFLISVFILSFYIFIFIFILISSGEGAQAWFKS